MSRRDPFGIFEESAYYHYKTKPKKAPTAAQLEALARGRAYRQQQYIDRYVAEAQSRYIKTKEFTEEFDAAKYVNRLRYSSEEQHITIKQAHMALMHTFPYTNKQDNYRYQIFQHVDWNELKRRVAEATGNKYTVVKKHDSAQLGLVRLSGLTREEIENSFVDSGAYLVAVFVNNEEGTNTTIRLRLVEGTGSDDPNFVEIR